MGFPLHEETKVIYNFGGTTHQKKQREVDNHISNKMPNSKLTTVINKYAKFNYIVNVL